MPPKSTPLSPSLTSPLCLALLREKLARYPASRLPGSDELTHAAVAILLREHSPAIETEILIIQRAEHPRDPWSGHLGFPGGRLETHDASPERAAVRETQEELGLSLDTCATLLGSLSEIRARSLSGLLPLSIFPFVYGMREPTPMKPNGEIVEANWIPLRFFLNTANRTTRPHPREPAQIIPCYPLGSRALWGLSLAMLDELLLEVPAV